MLAPITLSVGALLCILGAVFYAMPSEAGHKSITALMPLFLGFPIAVLGVLSRKESMRKHATHGALGLALLGFLGSLRGLKTWPALLSGGTGLTFTQQKAGWEMLLMFFICLIYLLIGVKSFIAARKAREAAASA